MSEEWRYFFEMYYSNGADKFIFILAPLLWYGSIFIVRFNCTQIRKAIAFTAMYSYVFGHLFCLLTNLTGSESLQMFLLFTGAVIAIILFFTSICELVYWCRKRVYSDKGKYLRGGSIMRSALQLLIITLQILSFFHTTLLYCIVGISC